MTARLNAATEQALETRERLLHSALRLYAREGLHGVSLRRISSAAGSRNSAAIHYHFHNKPGVIRALVEMIALELRAIDRRARAGETPASDLRTACQRTLRPLALLRQDQPWGPDALRFMSRLLSENDPEYAAIINPVYQTYWRRLDEHLAQLLPALPQETRRLRLMFMGVNVFHGFAEVSALAHTPLGDLSHIDSDTLLDQLVDYLLGGLGASTATQK